MLRFIIFLSLLITTSSAIAQPANDDCANAKAITISDNGYGFGVFNSSTDDISSATVQPTETFAPAILVAGQNKKSIWYKFTLATHRSIRVTLQQPGIAIAAGNAGFAVYKTDSCLPINNQLSSKLTPIATFGNTYHPCVEPGEYLIQVSSNQLANGPLSVRLQVSDSSGALYDHPSNAYAFGTLTTPTTGVSYYVGCQSIQNAEENCTLLPNYQAYTKSTWHTFKTPAYFDYLSVLFASPNGSFPGGFNRFGYNLYEGDVKTNGTSGLNLVDGCDTFRTNGYTPDHRMYKCGQLKPNTVYTVQLFFHQNFYSDVRLAISMSGPAPTNAPEPILSNIPTTNALGNLATSPSGVTTNAFDHLACNSRINTHPCDPSIPAAGVRHNNINYTLSTFFTFTLTTASNITITGANAQCGPNVLLRLFKQGVTNNCSDLDTANIINQFLYSGSMDCLPAGNYTLQVLGRDDVVPITNYHYGHLMGSSNLCMLTNLGQRVNVSFRVTRVNDINKFSLKAPGAYDTINSVNGVMRPLVPFVTYNAKIDTFGCENTVRPAGVLCAPNITKAMYRQFAVMDSGIVTISNLQSSLWYRMYNNDANAMATAQAAHGFPDSITGLTPVTPCMDYYGDCAGDKVCIVPGTYTFATFASQTHVGWTDRPSLRFTNAAKTKFHDFASAQNMGSILDTVALQGGTQVASAVDTFSCRDNAVPINGYMPCTMGGKPATKAIYRQFYLSEAAIVSISNAQVYCNKGIMTLFSGKITDGAAGLTPMGAPWNCFTSAQVSNACNPLPAGWYTIVSYGTGPSFENPLQNTSTYGNGNDVGMSNQIIIRVTKACPGPKYNRPYKAAIDTITKQPFLIEWAPRTGHTNAYPKTDTTYKLYTEYFNCTIDTPFASHPLPTCATGLNRVVYYVFKTTQESYVTIDTKNYWAQVFAHDVRFDSTLNSSATPIQTCLKSEGYIQLCRLQPGTYTLVLYATDANSCSSVQPTIYIDRIGYSRFDHAKNAYDFGVVPADSTFYNGKPGDVNPLDASRAPSNDFFYCTTGAQPNDPAQSGCYAKYNPAIYNNTINNALYTAANPPTTNMIARRNLWYTFVADKPGYITVRVTNKTTGKQYQYPFAIFKSDVDGSLPFSTVVSSGLIDSTTAQGLSLVSYTTSNTYFCGGTDKLTFYRDPCTQTMPERYYIVVDNRNPIGYTDIHAMNPNSQVEVAILIDTIDLVPTKFDHYSFASNMGTLAPGTHTGVTDNFSCATRDVKDPINGMNHCTKTLWYKFSTNVTGHVRYRIAVNGTRMYHSDNIRLFRETIPGDSINGLSYINPGTGFDTPTNSWWSQNCVSPGTYYILLPGCNRVNENVFPEIKILEQAGDFCSAPVTSALNGPGVAVSTVTVDCHTIGTDYGEFNPTLTCPANAVRDQYKSSWFRIDITGNDTVDVTAFLTENTTVNPADIQYRLMTGNCGAMQEQSCVQDAQTQNTYKCLSPGSYYIQVFTPVSRNGQPVTGTINLNLSAVIHADTCAPVNDCFANANFVPQFNCNTSDSVTFHNYSTYGSSIEYSWDFGYNGQTSTAVAPKFYYPALATSATYNVTLTVRNTECGLTNTTTVPVTIPARPSVNLGKDTVLCTASSILLDATSYPGATYLWQNNSTQPTFVANTTGVRNYHVKVTYNGCSKADTIQVSINPISARPLQQRMFCGNDSVQLVASRGYSETFRWNTGATSSSIYAKAAGTYWVDITWNGCTVRDSFNVVHNTSPLGNDTAVCLSQPLPLNATVPGATSYLWQNNSTSPIFNVTTPGQYWVRINFGSCSLRDTINVSAIAPLVTTAIATICNGQSFTLPSGAIITAAGIYKDTARTAGGCDSLITTFDVGTYPLIRETITASICPGDTYVLPSGATVSAAGIYNDTIAYAAGCDSLITTVDLQLKAVNKITSNAVKCEGEPYTLPWGQVVLVAGSYSDTLRYQAGCDSVITVVTITEKPAIRETKNVRICAGQDYTLPSGVVVSITGVYTDTLQYVEGCDSLITTTTITVLPVTRVTTTASICDGASYTLPSGTVVSAAGTYTDTLRYTSGCDSLITTTTLSIKPVVRNTVNASVCAGASYTLPSGVVVSAAGTYTDTLYYTAGCDSLITTTNLSVGTVDRETKSAIICEGASYTLPSGTVVTLAGTYVDTLQHASGCDSVIITTNLAVQTATKATASATICEGASYTLPSGAVVSAAGTYTDTLHYNIGCDSLITNTTITVLPVTRVTTTASICDGASYTLPSGTVVSAAGTYIDTLHYTSGCNSLITTTTLSIKPVVRTTVNASVCAGASYTLPSGVVVSAAGSYTDTLYYTAGCDSVITTTNLFIGTVDRETKTAVICEGANYTLPSGTVVTLAGTYVDTLQYTSGCDSLIITTHLAVQTVTRATASVTICEGASYTLPAGAVVSAAGTYTDTLHYTSGCDSLITTTTITVLPVTRITTTASICDGASYTLPSGTVVNAAGTYTDTLQYTSGCDSLITTITLTIKPVIRNTVNASVCAGASYTLPSGLIVSAAGTYVDTLHYSAGCDSVITTTNLSVGTVDRETRSAVICEGASYNLPSGTVVTLAGTYIDTLQHASGCDSVIITTNLAIQTVTRATATATICAGASYTLPSGTVVTLAGTYVDTLHYTTGCDSLITTTTVTVLPVTRVTTSASICDGASYTLPSGTVVSAAGTYTDTLRYSSGCDSLITTTTLSIKPVIRNTVNASVCPGASYTLPSGVIVSAAGSYTDTLYYTAGCDSVITTTNLSVGTVDRETKSAVVCEGASYTLPSGTVVTLAGTYVDTLQHASGCDSVIITTQLAIQTVTRATASATICEGASYTLPSGAVVSAAGTYTDTLHYATGCDSLITTTTINVLPLTRVTTTASICDGASYTLPSGTVVSAAGTYTDTLHYTSGCDSLITTTTLSIKPVVRNTVNASVCAGASYALPSGVVISAAGIYSDTLYYTAGCDSVITTTNLSVGTVDRETKSAVVCEGASYTLPSGTVVTLAGTYIDTLQHTSGCDSVIITTSLAVQTVTRATASATICEGASFTLPSGAVVSAAGTYTDTLHYNTGCDSLITTTTITVLPVTRVNTTAAICDGASYTLPSGTVVGAAGTYTDTLHYASGCDSLITTTTLSIKPVVRSTINASVCAGASYTLPSGVVVSAAGTYSDTLHYTAGCDSVITTATIRIRSVEYRTTSAAICAGGSFVLPSGRSVTTAGTYTDTLRYQAGCDSLITTLDLRTLNVTHTTTSATICAGSFYILPSGRQVSSSGTYIDTTRYALGCDSLITTITLVVRTVTTNNTSAAICEGETYTLPNGQAVTHAGVFSSIIRSSAGCDSIIYTTTLRVHPKPVLRLSKSNDVDCMIGTVKLTASGGRSYQWSPNTSLSSTDSYNPIATPSTTTTYKVKATSQQGCVAEDSIQVVVNKGNGEDGFLVPSAFTPNNDGKNDCFGVRHWGAVSNFNMMIYDRWGNIVFSTTDPSKCWDGRYKGVAAATAAYVYQINAVTNCGPVFRKGTVVLIR
ncbi:gliding motility-associated C-terminal domain-containing protein [Aridibaculum aurantiacum]|uniref:T9SS type B sorting domain-containing protein n=1 Tax=Aridibaculum aurantiacum TaxID=2810307 RepID=UPI001A9741AA|nr:gliding motility-associated C-terminal domain-containing protein [Aridibaculum aurantiacum]